MIKFLEFLKAYSISVHLYLKVNIVYIYIIGIVVMSRYDGISYSQVVIETLRVDVGIVNAKDETDHVMMFTEYCCHMFLMEFCSKNVENVGRLRC